MEIIDQSKCRLCLKFSNKMENLFSNDTKYLHIINDFTGLTVHYRPEFPSSICLDCINTINILIEFKEKCRKSEEILENQYRYNLIQDNIWTDTKLNDGMKKENLIDEENQLILADNIKKEYDISPIKSDNDTNNDNGNDDDNVVNLEESGKSQKNKIKTKNKTKSNQKQKSSEKSKNAKISKNNNDTSNECKTEEPETKSWKKYAKTYETPCYICGKLYDKFRIQYHINNHLGLRPFKCNENNCDKEFPSPMQLRQHKKYIHSDDAPHECDICGRRFKGKAVLKLHKTYHFDPQIPCNVCGKLLRNRKSLKKHMFNHTDERPYKCDECLKCFKNQWSLKVHCRTHTKEKPYICTLCGMPFRYNSVLKHHTRKKHPESIGLEPDNNNKKSVKAKNKK